MKRSIKPLLFFCLLLFFHYRCSSQNNSSGPQEVTPEIARKIKADIEKQIPALIKQYRIANDTIKEEIAFRIDTFRIERFWARSMDYNYSTSGMNEAGYAAADKYDSLLNKYYKLLMAELGEDDKKTLVLAQRAWLAFKDKELDLISSLRKEKYSGGGTIQSNIYAGYYIDMIKERVFTIFHDYLDIINPM